MLLLGENIAVKTDSQATSAARKDNLGNYYFPLVMIILVVFASQDFYLGRYIIIPSVNNGLFRRF